MFEGIRFYYYFIFGALGGATGWFVGGLLRPAAGRLLASQQGAGANMYEMVVYGCALGACIGLAVAVYDGLASHSMRRFMMFAMTGVGLGIVAGGVALALAQRLYDQLMGGRAVAGPWDAAAFVLCWALFGGLIGFIEGVHKGTQSWKGFLGGIVGGLCGGALYQAVVSLRGKADGDDVKELSLAVSLALLGGAIGAAVVFVTVKFRQAFVEIVNGKRATDRDDVTKHVVRRKGSRAKPGLIGSDSWSASVYLPGDKGVMPRHAQISFINGAPTLTVLPDAVYNSTTLVNGKRVTVCPLEDGDRIQVGSTTLIYHQRRK